MTVPYWIDHQLKRKSFIKKFNQLSLLIKLSANLQPNLIIYGDIKVVIIVIAPTIGSRKELVTPTSIPPFATTSASSPPEQDNPIPALRDDNLLKPCDLPAKYTVMNFATSDTAINIRAGTMNSGKSEISINAPTDTKNKAANMSLIGVANTLETACDFDSAINTPAKKAPAATDIPS